MIQKDIGSKGATSSELFAEGAQDAPMSIDDIFAAADQEMANQINASKKHFRVKKKRQHPIRNAIITVLLGIVVFVVGIAILGAQIAKREYPQMKENFLIQVGTIQEQLRSTDDEELTVDEYYQKQLLLLLTKEDLENAINSLEDMADISQILALSESANLTLIPEEKIDEYNRIQAEYQAAISHNDNDDKTENVD